MVHESFYIRLFRYITHLPQIRFILENGWTKTAYLDVNLVVRGNELLELRGGFLEARARYVSQENVGTLSSKEDARFKSDTPEKMYVSKW
jgi:hypothetical protein